MLKVHIIPRPANKLAWCLFHALISWGGCSVQVHLGCQEGMRSTQTQQLLQVNKRCIYLVTQELKLILMLMMPFRRRCLKAPVNSWCCKAQFNHLEIQYLPPISSKQTQTSVKCIFPTTTERETKVKRYLSLSNLLVWGLFDYWWCDQEHQSLVDFYKFHLGWTIFWLWSSDIIEIGTIAQVLRFLVLSNPPAALWKRRWRGWRRLSVSPSTADAVVIPDVQIESDKWAALFTSNDVKEPLVLEPARPSNHSI